MALPSSMILSLAALWVSLMPCDKKGWLSLRYPLSLTGFGITAQILKAEETGEYSPMQHSAWCSLCPWHPLTYASAPSIIPFTSKQSRFSASGNSFWLLLVRSRAGWSPSSDLSHQDFKTFLHSVNNLTVLSSSSAFPFSRNSWNQLLFSATKAATHPVLVNWRLSFVSFYQHEMYVSQGWTGANNEAQCVLSGWFLERDFCISGRLGLAGWKRSCLRQQIKYFVLGRWKPGKQALCFSGVMFQSGGGWRGARQGEPVFPR